MWCRSVVELFDRDRDFTQRGISLSLQPDALAQRTSKSRAYDHGFATLHTRLWELSKENSTFAQLHCD